jgi:AcrR family transcriptional regulator
MPARAVTQIQARKTPVQARAAVTVGAISEATIQVLLGDGVERLTTTRVAERAGVSVGTLYQYYPNKQAFLAAKLERPDISMALYQFAADVGGPALAKRVGQRSRKALESVLHTAPDIQAAPDKFAIEMMAAAMSGTTRYVLEAGASPAMIRGLRHHLVVLCQSYMSAALARSQSPASAPIARR